jgi:hypothetical protein
MTPRAILYIADSASIEDDNRVLMDLAAGISRDDFAPLILTPGDGPLEAWAADHDIPVCTMRSGVTAAARTARDHGVALVHAMAPECARLAGILGDLLDVPHRCHVPGPAVDTRIYRPAPVNWEAHQRLRAGAGHVVLVVTHGAHSADDRSWQCAAADISPRLPDCRFLTLDDCREDRPDVLRAADVVVLPWLHADRPRELLEAMSCAKPVVAAPIGRVCAALVDEQTGLIVPANQPARLADAVLRVLTDRPLSQRIGIAGRGRVQAQFSVHRLVFVVQAMYREMIDRFEPARRFVPGVDTGDPDSLRGEDARQSSIVIM